MDLAQVDREGSWWQELVWLYSGSSSWSVVVVMGMMACALHGGSVVLRIFKKNAKNVDIFIDVCTSISQLCPCTSPIMVQAHGSGHAS